MMMYIIIGIACLVGIIVVVLLTDGEKWNKLQEIYKEAGSMETAIEKYKQLKQKSYETEMSM